MKITVALRQETSMVLNKFFTICFPPTLKLTNQHTHVICLLHTQMTVLFWVKNCPLSCWIAQLHSDASERHIHPQCLQSDFEGRVYGAKPNKCRSETPACFALLCS